MMAQEILYTEHCSLFISSADMSALIKFYMAVLRQPLLLKYYNVCL